MVDPLAVQQRLHNWCKIRETRLTGDHMAPAFIERVGVATLYPASPEIPNLFWAYLGDPEARTDSGWDTPSGEVYTWRWKLGRKSAAFYTALIRRRPTWIRWSLLPAILRLCGSLRSPDCANARSRYRSARHQRAAGAGGLSTRRSLTRRLSEGCGGT